jgi:hypothetical protein
MKLLEEIENCPSDDRSCPETSGIVFSFIALMVYMVLGNVLLINLLIAMFSSTFQDVQENTDQIWKFQRYRLVFEYYDSPILPPPFNIIAYFFSMVQYVMNKKNDTGVKQADDCVDAKGNIYQHFLNYSRAGLKNKLLMNLLDDVDLLLDREKKFAEEYVRIESVRESESVDSRLKSNLEK